MKLKKIFILMSLVLLILGGINWGLISLFYLDLIKFLFGFLPIIQNLIYLVIGVSAIYIGILLIKKEIKI